MVECYLGDGPDSGPKPAKRPGWTESRFPASIECPGLHPSSVTGQCQCVPGAAASISAAAEECTGWQGQRQQGQVAGWQGQQRQWQQPRGNTMAGRVSTNKVRSPAGRVNSRGAMPPAGMAKTIPGLCQRLEWPKPSSGICQRLARSISSVAAPAVGKISSGSTGGGEMSGERPGDGKDTGRSGKASGISGSTGRVRPTAGMVNGTAGRVSRVRPTPGRVSTSRVSTSKVRPPAGSTEWLAGSGSANSWQGQHQQGRQQQAQQSTTGQTNPDILIPARVTAGSKLPPVPPVRLVQPVPPALGRPARPVPTSILIAAPFRRVSLPPRPVPGIADLTRVPLRLRS